MDQSGSPGSQIEQAKPLCIYLPQGTPWEPERALALVQHLLSQFKSITFQLVAYPGQIIWQVVDIDGGDLAFYAEAFSQAVRAIYPAAEVDRAENPRLSYPFWRQLTLYSLADDFYWPLIYVSDLKPADPLSYLTQSMAGLSTGQRIIYTVRVTAPVAQEVYKKAQKELTRAMPPPPLLYPNNPLAGAVWAVSLLFPRPRTSKYEDQYQRVAESKIQQLLYHAAVAVQIDSPNRQDLDRLEIISASLSLFTGEYNILKEISEIDLGRSGRYKVGGQFHITTLDEDVKAPTASKALFSSSTAVAEYIHGRTVLSSEELAALWHLPHEGFAASEIAWIAKGRAPEVMLSPTEGAVILGTNLAARSPTLIYLQAADRDTHINIVGKTKVGKSTFMHHLIHQDIAAGRGVAIIDPHGKLVSDVLRASIPDWRFDDVVVIDIADEEYPPPLNLMAVPGEQGQAAAGQVVAVLDKVYGGFEHATRAAATLSAALQTLWQEPNPTVRDVNRLFRDADYRHRLLERLDDDLALEFWEEFEALSYGQQQEIAYPVLYRMRTFYGNPYLYPIICHPTPIDFAGLMAQNKIILVSLKVDEEKVRPREQQLLGALLVSQLQMAGMKSGATRQPFYLYVDEAQYFVTTALDTVLSEARKYGMGLILANQFLGQLKGKTLDAVMGNVGATVIFQTGPDDARSLKPYVQPEFDIEDLMNLDLHQAVVKTRVAGKNVPAFTLASRPPISEWDNADEIQSYIRQRSRAQYTVQSRAEVMAWLKQRYPRPQFGAKGKSPDEPGALDDWIVSSDE